MAKLQVLKFNNIEEARLYYLAKVDEVAEKARAAIITAAPGQTMTYEAKYQEAKRFQDLNDNGPFPWLQGEAEELGLTVEQVATSVLIARDAWQNYGIAIERARLKAKANINEATAPAVMAGVLKSLTFA